MKVFSASGVFAVTSIAAMLQITAAKADTVYVTGFAKDNNIYTNLNQNFPNTGSGTPGSGAGTANASFLYNPYAYNQGFGVSGSDLAGNNGINFNLTSDASGHDFASIGSTPFAVNIGVQSATNVYFLASSYTGQSFNVTFTGTGGATETFSNVYLPDFNGGAPVNGSSGGALTQTVYQVNDVGAGGTGNSSTGANNTYDLTEVGFTLNSSFDDQTLTSATITSNGYETLLLGVTVTDTVTGAVPEPSTWAMLIMGFVGIGVMARRRRLITVKAA